jgi:hypothetical protein
MEGRAFDSCPATMGLGDKIKAKLHRKDAKGEDVVEDEPDVAEEVPAAPLASSVAVSDNVPTGAGLTQTAHPDVLDSAPSIDPAAAPERLVAQLASHQERFSDSTCAHRLTDAIHDCACAVLRPRKGSTRNWPMPKLARRRYASAPLLDVAPDAP